LGATKVLELVAGLTPDDLVIFLVSGGGSALFEKPLEGVSLEDVMGITNELLSCGADILEINTIRKHLSAVKGGRFAQQCGGAKIFSIVLSDVVGDKLDAIASGPAYPDSTTSADAFRILQKYHIRIGDHLAEALGKETPKMVANCETVVTGSVTALCEAAARSAELLGYTPLILTTAIDCEAKEIGRLLASKAKEIRGNDTIHPRPPCAIIAGGETIVLLTGSGKGGRNQEVALAAAMGIAGMEEVVIFSVGSDGTDGPTEAAGGMVDGQSIARMRARSIDPAGFLANNDSYHALKASGDLVMTGPTGTNVNDLMVVLLR
jgi:hydroxypyruvate reductase